MTASPLRITVEHSKTAADLLLVTLETNPGVICEVMHTAYSKCTLMLSTQDAQHLRDQLNGAIYAALFEKGDER